MGVLDVVGIEGGEGGGEDVEGVLGGDGRGVGGRERDRVGGLDDPGGQGAGEGHGEARWVGGTETGRRTGRKGVQMRTKWLPDKW